MGNNSSWRVHNFMVLSTTGTIRLKMFVERLLTMETTPNSANGQPRVFLILLPLGWHSVRLTVGIWHVYWPGLSTQALLLCFGRQQSKQTLIEFLLNFVWFGIEPSVLVMGTPALRFWLWRRGRRRGRLEREGSKEEK
jgi:hypothetical protein